MRNWEKAFFLVCYAPKFVWDTIKEYAEKYKKNIILGSAIIGVLFVCLINLNWKSCGGELHIVDVSAAFSTNNIRPTTEAVVIHHTAGTLNDNINGIAKIHFGDHKWSTIGYHYFINADGVVFQLKPENEVAPHSFHYNENSVAICLAGNFNNYEPTKAQWTAVVLLTRQIVEKYGLTPSDVYKHGELRGNNTECCGKMFNIEKLKEEL